MVHILLLYSQSIFDFLSSTDQYMDTFQSVYSLFTPNMYSLYSLNKVSVLLLYSQKILDFLSV